MKIISTIILAFFLVMCSHSSSKKNSNINGEKTRTEEANEKSNGEEPVPRSRYATILLLLYSKIIQNSGENHV